jgi:FixJ family two-component response regulator
MDDGAGRFQQIKWVPSRTSALAASAKSHLISIIDDDPSVRLATQSLVRSLGYTAEVFSSAEEYLQSGSVSGSSCVITDLHMPGMSGSDLQDRLIADGRQIPIIFMTAYFEERTLARVMDAGAVGFLRKPFADERLIECLDRALGISAAKQ